MSHQISIFEALRFTIYNKTNLIRIEFRIKTRNFIQQDSSYLNLSLTPFAYIPTYYFIYPLSLIFEGKYYYQNLFQNSNK